ncbi:MAG: hypothetical protein COU71_02940 [Parcubacteria group bacterium CG10_big_fil_rev_8_21_14_0_10_38_31]|nr:MAG: hypothetical protein COU71_02940 [Parcubacteria group bacterium CG10_big_fil_rev_8_21_14_0_10_38_31]
MARFEDREKAIKLRLEGKSYSQIKEVLNVAKSTLSYWLKDYPLSEEKIKELRDKNPIRIEKYRATRAKQKKDRLDEVYKEERRKKLLPSSKRDLFIAGLFLYWGEGGKTVESRLTVSNTNPAVIKFFVKWLNECLDVSLANIKIYLHLYNDMDIKKEIEFWVRELNIPQKQFRKPYVKKSSSKRINYKIRFSHGTCNAMVGDVRLTERILINLRIIEDSLKN